MFPDHDGDPLKALAAHRMRSLQAKWDRLTVFDLANVRTKTQLAACIEQRYGLSRDVAIEDVEIWAMNRRLA